MGRPPIGDRAMSDAERQRRRRERLSKAAGPKPAKAAKRARAAADDRELTEARAEIERLRAELAAKALPEIKKKSEVPPTALAAYIASIPLTASRTMVWSPTLRASALSSIPAMWR